MNWQKKMKYAGLAILIVGTVCYAFGAAMAHGRGGGPGKGGRGGWGQQRGPGYGAFMRNEMATASIETLVELSGKSKETIEEKLEYKPMWAVLDEYGVDFKTFRSKMQKRAEGILDKAVADGKISDAQKSAMLERMENAPGRKFGGQGGRRQGNGKGPGFAGGPCW